MVHVSIFHGVTTPKYANMICNVDDSREPMKKFMLSSLIFFRSRSDEKWHLREAVSAIWFHKGGKKHGFVVQFSHVGAWTCVTLASIAMCRGFPRGFPHPGLKIFT